MGTDSPVVRHVPSLSKRWLHGFLPGLGQIFTAANSMQWRFSLSGAMQTKMDELTLSPQQTLSLRSQIRSQSWAGDGSRGAS